MICTPKVGHIWRCISKDRDFSFVKSAYKSIYNCKPFTHPVGRNEPP